MLFTKASEYALLSLILISQKSSPVDVDTISNELKISKSFLAKILQNLAKDGVLNIKATDHEIGLAYKLSNAKIVDEGYATANGKKLLDIIKSLKDEEVMLETVNNYLYIKQKNSKYKLPMYKFEDFPEFPTIEGKSKFDIDAVMLGRSLKKILPSIDSNNPKFELNGAFLDIKKDLINIVGTDTRRLSVFKFQTPTEKEFSLIILSLIHI